MGMMAAGRAMILVVAKLTQNGALGLGPIEGATT